MAWRRDIPSVLRVSATESLHRFLGLPLALQPEYLVLYARRAGWFIGIRVMCPNHLTCCLFDVHPRQTPALVSLPVGCCQMINFPFYHLNVMEQTICHAQFLFHPPQTPLHCPIHLGKCARALDARCNVCDPIRDAR